MYIRFQSVIVSGVPTYNYYVLLDFVLVDLLLLLQVDIVLMQELGVVVQYLFQHEHDGLPYFLSHFSLCLIHLFLEVVNYSDKHSKSLLELTHVASPDELVHQQVQLRHLGRDNLVLQALFLNRFI